MYLYHVSSFCYPFVQGWLWHCFKIFIFNWRIIIYSIVMISAIHQHESTIGIHMSPPSWTSLPIPPFLVVTEYRLWDPCWLQHFLSMNVLFWFYVQCSRKLKKLLVKLNFAPKNPFTSNLRWSQILPFISSILKLVTPTMNPFW